MSEPSVEEAHRPASRVIVTYPGPMPSETKKMTDRARPADVPSSPPDAPAVRAARLTSTLRTSATTNAPRLRGGGAREAGGERSV